MTTPFTLRRLALASVLLLSASAFAQDASAPASASASAAASATSAPTGPRVSMKTTMGEIVIELNAEKAPLSTNNFLAYVKSGHYKGTTFHRVIDGFMIQGGGFDKEMHQKPTNKPIQNEAKNGLKNDTYTIAMARTGDPHSATAQFFINVNNNSGLDYPSRDGWGYAVFGRVIQGTEVVDKIAKVATGAQGPFNKDVPSKAIVIESTTILK
jgi:peptidyl-prolyl cis-trans isomerase A (cyclophilin A)